LKSTAREAGWANIFVPISRVSGLPFACGTHMHKAIPMVYTEVSYIIRLNLGWTQPLFVLFRES
jgi:hypothetical protein